MDLALNTLDIGILILVSLSTIIGLFRGFMKEALSLLTWLAAFGFAIYYAESLAPLLPVSVESDMVRLAIAFASIFLVMLILGSILNYLITQLVNSVGLGVVDHIFGGAFGLLRGGLIVSLLVILLGMGPFPQQDWWKQSQLIPRFEEYAVSLKGVLPKAEGLFRHLGEDIKTKTESL